MCANCFTGYEALALNSVALATAGSSLWQRLTSPHSRETVRRRAYNENARWLASFGLDPGAVLGPLPDQVAHDADTTAGTTPAGVSRGAPPHLMRRALPYVLSFLVYVALGLWLRTVVLNWIVGPLWLMFTLEIIPRALGIGSLGEDEPAVDMSWAAHEFENYFIQKHTAARASFLAIVLGTLTPDLFTKFFVYASDDPAKFHRGWPGVGFTHSLIFGFALAVIVLAATKSRSWALGILIGQWAHVLTDFADTAGTMPFFPFSIEPVTISMWKHAAAEGRYGDAAAYYSSLGGVWDFFWCAMLLLFAWRTLRRDYFRTVVIPADPKVWAWLHRKFNLTERALFLFYLGFFFYGLGRMTSWFLYARFGAKTPFQPIWGGPEYIAGNDISDAGTWEVLIRTGIGGVLFALFLWLCWIAFIRRLWERGVDPPAIIRGKGLRTAFVTKSDDPAIKPSKDPDAVPPASGYK